MNVLVITTCNYNYLGGIENYNRLMYTSFPDINFYEIATLDRKFKKHFKFNNVENIETSINLDPYFDVELDSAYLELNNAMDLRKNNKKLSKKLESIIKDKKIDKILISGYAFFDKRFLKKYRNKVIFIQHLHINFLNLRLYYSFDHNKFLERNDSIKRKIFNRIFEFDFAKYCYNFVCCDPYSVDELRKFAKNKNIDWTPIMSRLVNKNEAISKKYEFISPIRNSKEKSPKMIRNIINNIGNNSLIIGTDFKDKKDNFVQYKSAVSNENELASLYCKSKYLLLASRYEGFSIVSGEALSLGLPCILPNTFPSARYLVGNNERGYIYNWYDDIGTISKNIQSYIQGINYEIVSKRCIKFATENLDNKTFKNNWERILKR